MTEQTSLPRRAFAEQARYMPANVEALTSGGRTLHRAFAQAPLRFAGRDAPLLRAGEPDLGAVLIRSGFAYRSCGLPDGRRAILDILVPGDVTGLDYVVLTRPVEEICAAGRVSYQALGAAALHELMADPAVMLRMLAVVADARWRSDRLAACIGRLDAQARLCVLLLDIYDRLRRRNLIARPSFNLPLTQEQIGDHLGLTLVHVNRTLRRLREERLVLLDRQVVIITDVERLREMAQGLPLPAEMPEPALLAERVGA